ncbi:uncharacterized protein MONBRDRAFT_30619 [Monosiga brevicollis MX1]|uniref:Integrase catalytic domain-containing protein n=1 Tax=Monosiga brevicollis TaxID=81824 RepID=A9VEG3_MONBE|nr:uncharacterized protein MONBRDRAFT_30619 [Monosiga brevicollis MX1]EDQ84078.1 predicted protein [Monosiga brevicollis MX1]|eukprot:XP_001751110.1 hypothetical protein [Monosiga brevicollis MX1]
MLQQVEDTSDVKAILNCNDCNLFKAKRLALAGFDRDRTPRMPGELVASDMFGPLRSPNIKGARYIIAYRDVATGFLWLDPVCRKDDLAESFARLIRDSPIPIRIDEADMQKRTIIQR